MREDQALDGGTRRARADPGARSTISRRDLLRATAGGLGGLVLAACGASGPESPVASGPSSATPTLNPPSASPAPVSPSPTQRPSPAPLPLEQIVAGLLVVGFRGLSLADAPWLRDGLATGLGGVILFDRDQQAGGERNIRSPAQVAALVAEIRAAAGARHVWVAVDQEGGIVTRLGPSHGFPPLASEAAVGQGTIAGARAWAAGLASTLATAGIDLDFAPVVDLDVNPASPAIGALGRSFSADPARVAELATIEIEALRAKGVRSTLKHFPGIGSSTGNTDFGVVDVTATWSRTELEPFSRLIAARTADMVMVGHVFQRGLDPQWPASLSPAVVGGLLRGELGWGGPVVTDDLQAAGITRLVGADEAVVRALAAGDDLLLFANQQVYDPGVVGRVVAAVGRAVAAGQLTEAAVRAAWTRAHALG
ncbi:MAG TPA: glycoside hydrolase family 3 N-terminal domain-containing protein [Candidatus Limnocylindrales bacterium]